MHIYGYNAIRTYQRLAKHKDLTESGHEQRHLNTEVLKYGPCGRFGCICIDRE